MRLALTVFAVFILNGCASIQSSQPLSQYVTAIAKDDQRQIIWLDERVNTPEKLTQLMLFGRAGYYQTEYRWNEGVLREIDREEEKVVDGELSNISMRIRFDHNGQAVYQQYLVNDEIFPIKNDQLTRYYKQAQSTYQTAQSLIEQNKFFFQGYIQEGKIRECGTNRNKLLTISDPLYANDIFDNEKRFIAAMGTVSFMRNTAEVVIALEDADFPCFTRPVFAQSE